ncbi:MAG TPA: hypothetical protein VEJ18_19355 [Planctomycetota bacterium]|nr:hypothetical protein [Planctomycetota bacterium]
MRRAAALLLGLAGCTTSSLDVDDERWSDRAEVVCYRPGCGHCGGRGHVACAPCRGDGFSRCTQCRDGRERCGSCRGDGSLKGKTCRPCGGRGVRACSRCGGDQRIECPVCSAKGRLHCLRPLPITEPRPAPEDRWPPSK